MPPAQLPPLWDQCQIFACSGRFGNTTPEQAFVAIMAGRELGLGPFASMSGVHVINGKPTMSANLRASFVKSSAKYDYRLLTEKEQQASHLEVCSIRFFEILNGEKEELGVEVYTMKNAHDASLTGKDPWKKYPKAMLFARCISNGTRTHCPDIFHGMAVYGEGEIE